MLHILGKDVRERMNSTCVQLRITFTWDRLTMVSQSKGYYDNHFKGFCGVTHGDPLSPTIFNMVVDALLRHWVTVVAELEEAAPMGAAITEGFKRYVQRLETYFYPDYMPIVSMRETRLQKDFDTLTELFNCVGLRTNVAKTVIMVCQPCRGTDHQRSEERQF